MCAQLTSNVIAMSTHRSLQHAPAGSFQNSSAACSPAPFNISAERWTSFSLDKRRKLLCLANSIMMVQKKIEQRADGELAELPSIPQARREH
ncbi:hypothetical protein GUITHDRAFT_152479 [Guillardia theta CCMP2712]|uniref:Uncharacterized protein n=1 Tax=Guillardia theta (strain CCMP2712) TaxID=905079 RepID=L1JDI4_GUITC|nr:hypothetical protein GUITHDRAFT_152479 [Guillardia theta CCMP2712]EKX46342.1 hypothetical protein GUITHDRAFT_152479 [Guillardia theta CCMP2712]|mmetsp:Transcript_29835/g.95428  ORF Transcript_29835/g.95428 Transcript_29835/m.95428 type:complete len:92 (+) Transcript_29835:63-338(+)|eukprot:XP_005833322.1 hypothetical protein GUITHDRAFT_152479 [Guillardia theta CCMP2712]